MGDFIQVPKQDMIKLGDDLNQIKWMLESQKKDGSVIDGLDSQYGSEHVGIGEEGFVEAWKTAIDKLLEAIGGTGDLSKSIGVGADSIDKKVAESGNKAADQLSGFNLHV